MFLLYTIAIAYLLLNTGIISDDFDTMAKLKGRGFMDILIPRGIFCFIETPVEYFTHYIWYRFFNLDSRAAVNIFKMFYIILSFYFISRFFRIYLKEGPALLASFLFLFFPSHDSTTYWFMGQYLTISIAFYLYAFYLAHYNKLTLAFISSLIASFISYGSPVVALALFVLFALHGEFKKGAILLIPNILYSIYYIFISRLSGLGTYKISGAVNINVIAKQFILQILTFIDAMIGPSMWLKIYYSFSQMKPVSFLIAAAAIAVFYKLYSGKRERYDARLALSLISLLFLSLLMFSLTGLYPQLSFTLGNRVTIFGSLLAAYLIVILPLNRLARTAFLALIVFAILGISDHWKAWNIRQEAVIANIRSNRSLENYDDRRMLYFSGNQYSRYGPISHIEFLSEGWVTWALFDLAFGRRVSTSPINKRFRYIDGYLVDAKYNEKVKVSDYINVYDSEENTLIRLRPDEINKYIDGLPSDKRHWVQMLDIKVFKNTALKLMPRLRYLLISG